MNPHDIHNARRSLSGRFASRTEAEMDATLARVLEARVVGVSRQDATRAMRQERASKLSAAQRREVRRMLEDGEATTRAEAVAWVLEMEGA